MKRNLLLGIGIGVGVVLALLAQPLVQHFLPGGQIAAIVTKSGSTPRAGAERAVAAFNKRDLATLVDDLLAVADDDPGVYKISAREEVKVRHERNTRTLFEELGGEQLTLAEGYWNPSSGQDAEGRYTEALFRTNRDGTFMSVWRLKSGKWVFSELRTSVMRLTTAIPMTEDGAKSSSVPAPPAPEKPSANANPPAAVPVTPAAAPAQPVVETPPPTAATHKEAAERAVAAINKHDAATLAADSIALLNEVWVPMKGYPLDANERRSEEAAVQDALARLDGSVKLQLAEGYWVTTAGKDAQGRYTTVLYTTNQNGTHVWVTRMATGVWGFSSLRVGEPKLRGTDFVLLTDKAILSDGAARPAPSAKPGGPTAAAERAVAALNKRDGETLVLDLLALPAYGSSGRDFAALHARNMFKQMDAGPALILGQGYWDPGWGKHADGGYKVAFFTTNRADTLLYVEHAPGGKWVYKTVNFYAGGQGSRTLPLEPGS